MAQEEIKKEIKTLKRTVKRKRLTGYSPYIAPAAVLSVALFYGLVYFGVSYRNDYAVREEMELRAERELLAQKEKDLEEEARMRDEEILSLREAIEALRNEPKEEEKEQVTVSVETGGGEDIVAIVKKWSPRVAQIKCNWYASSGTLVVSASGSATLANFAYLGIKAITSGHLFIKTADKSLPKDCKITLGGGQSYTVAINVDNTSISEKEDWAYVSLPRDETLSGITRENIRLCGSVETGDRLLILGYPKIGAKTGLTVTDGILSGEDGDYYITSAKIDKGNSGGAAILVKDNCFLGIPSASVVGTIESLGRILKAKFVLGN